VNQLPHFRQVQHRPLPQHGTWLGIGSAKVGCWHLSITRFCALLLFAQILSTLGHPGCSFSLTIKKDIDGDEVIITGDKYLIGARKPIVNLIIWLQPMSVDRADPKRPSVSRQQSNARDVV
jgi:hypothetical protein